MIITSRRLHGLRCVFAGLALACSGCVASPAGTQDGASQTQVGSLGPSCAVDADCRVVPDYCARCACVALPASDGLAACSGQSLTCLIDPCHEQVARCVRGSCTAMSGARR